MKEYRAKAILTCMAARILGTYETEKGKRERKCLNRDYKALEMAISALEKQIPKKPIREEDEPFPEECGDCPICGFSVYFYDDKFCYNCGQALDWSEEE